MTGGAGGNKHVACRQSFRRRVEIEQPLLRLEHDPVLGFVVNLDLRMVWAHVALGASARQAGDADRSRCAGCGKRCRFR